MCINSWSEGTKRMEPGHFQWYPMTGTEAMGTNRNKGESLWTSENTIFYCEGAWEVAQVAQRGCGIFSVNIQKAFRNSSRHLAPSGPSWAWVLDQVISKCSFQPQPFCGSVILWKLTSQTKEDLKSDKLLPSSHTLSAYAHFLLLLGGVSALHVNGDYI